MGTYVERTIETNQYEDGSITKAEQIKKLEYKKNAEPDFIKIYRKMWCEFNLIPEKYQPMFIILAANMTYADINDYEGGQLVHPSDFKKTVMKKYGWKTEDPFVKGIKALVSCGALRKVKRDTYQVNGRYAGRGDWLFDPKYNRGGIENIVAKFDFKNRTVDTEAVFVDPHVEERVRTVIPLEASAEVGDSIAILTTDISPDPEYEQTQISDFCDTIDIGEQGDKAS